MIRHVVGLDIGGTKIACALLRVEGDIHSYLTNPPTTNDKTFKLLDISTVPTNRQKGYEHILSQATQLIVAIRIRMSIDTLAGIGIGMPGSIDTKRRMQNGNTMALIGKDFCTDLLAKLQMQTICVCENDASCFVLAEALSNVGLAYHHQQGVPLDKQIVLGLTLGTGLGAGLFSQGKLWRGKDYSAFEVGHAVFQRGGKMCYCGRRGCVEQYLSGTALEADYSKRSYRQVDAHVDAQEIFALAEKNNPAAVASVKRYREDLAHLLADLGNIFDPHYFVLGGGISTQAQIYQTLQQDMERELFCPHPPPAVRQYTISNSAGALGAAMLPLLV